MQRYTRENTHRITASESGSVRIACPIAAAATAGTEIEVEAFGEIKAATVENTAFDDHQAIIYARIN